MNHRQRRVSGALSATLALAMILAACSGGDGNKEDTTTDTGGTSDQEAADDESDEPVEITFWTHIAGSQAAADKFNETHDDIQVTFTEIPGGDDGYSKIANAVAAGNAPDVTGVEYNRLPEFVSNGLLTDLSDDLGDWVAESFPEAVSDMVNLGGSTWAAPYDAGIQVMYYRRDLLEEYGIDLASLETWDGYMAAAREIKEASGGEVLLTHFPPAHAGNFMLMAWQAGTPWYAIEDDSWVVSIDNEASRQVAEYWDTMLTEELVVPVNPWSEEENLARSEGQVATVLGAVWMAGGFSVTMEDLAGKWGVAPLPHYGTPASGMFGGTSFAIAEGSEKVEAAAEFIKWLTTSPDAVQARIDAAERPSSALPANPEARAAAAEAFDTTWLGGDDLFAIAGDLADNSLVTGWRFAVGQSVADSAFNDVALADSYVAGLAAAQEAAVSNLTEMGLAVTE